MAFNTSASFEKASNFGSDGSDYPDHFEYLSSDESTLPSTPPSPVTQCAPQHLKTKTAQQSSLAQQLQYIDWCQELAGVGHGPSTLPQPAQVKQPQESSQGYGFEMKKKSASKPWKGKKQTTQQKDAAFAPPAFPLLPGPVLGGEQWSRGSKNHYLGKCRPCRAFNTPQGCTEGGACNFCHCKHDQQKLVESDVYSKKAIQRRAQQQTKPDSEQSCACNSQARAKTVESLVFDAPWYAPMPSSMMMTFPPGLDHPITLSL